MRIRVMLVAAISSTLLMTACSGSSGSTPAPTPPPASSAGPEGVSTKGACEEISTTYERVQGALEREQAKSREMRENDTKDDDMYALSVIAKAWEKHDAAIIQLYASLWPQVADPDLKDVLKSLSRTPNDQANLAALNGMCGF